MGASDIIELLKDKEEEMEGVMEDARKRACAIKEETAKVVSNLKENAVKEIALEAETIKAGEFKRLGLEIEKIEEEGRKTCSDLADKVEARMEEAVTIVYDRIIGKE